MWSGFRSGVGDAARAGGVVDGSAELFSFGAEDGWDGMGLDGVVLFIFYAGFFVGSVAGIFWFLSGAPKNHMRKKISGVLSLPNALCVYNDNRRWDVHHFVGRMQPYGCGRCRATLLVLRLKNIFMRSAAIERAVRERCFMIFRLHALAGFGMLCCFFGCAVLGTF